MELTVALAAGASMVALALAGSTFERWLARRGRHQLAWSISLVFFACGALALWAGAALGWDDLRFRIFYLFGAVLNVPVLALGSVYLLSSRRTADAWAAGVALALAFAAGVVLSAPLTGPVGGPDLPQGSEVFGPLPRVLAAVASGVGALVVFSGAAVSALRLLRRGGERRLALGNAVVAAGTATLSASGLLNSVADEMQAFALTLAAGVSILFAGFLLATPSPGAAERAAPAAEPGVPWAEGVALTTLSAHRTKKTG